MLHEVEVDNPKLDRIDVIDDAFKRFRIRSDEIAPTKITLRVDNYNDEELDSNSDDGRSFRAKSREGSGEREPEIFKKTTLQQAMSTGSDTSAVSTESETLERGNRVPWFRSSSDGSSPSTSDVESDSDNSTDDEEDCSDSEDLLKKLEELQVSGGDNDGETKSQRDVNSNNKADEKHVTNNKTLENDNDNDDMNRHPNNVPIVFKNKKIDNTDQDDSEDDDSVRTRGLCAKPHHRGKPYDRESPTNVAPANNLTVAEIYSEDFETLDPILDILEAEWPNPNRSREPPNIPYVTVSSPIPQPPTSTDDFGPDPMTISTPIIQSSAMQQRQIVPTPLSSGSSIFSDENGHSPVNYVSDIGASNQGKICKGIQEFPGWNNESPSTSTSPTASEQNDFNPLDLFEQNSPQSWGQLQIDNFVQRGSNHIYDDNYNFDPPKSGMEAFNETFQDKTQNSFTDIMRKSQTNVYTPFPNAMPNIPELQENSSISQSSVQSGLDQQTATLPGQMNPSQITSTGFSVPTTKMPTQNGISFSPPANTLQFHTVTTAMQDGTGSVTITNPDFTARGTVTITRGNNPIYIDGCMQNIIQQSGDQDLPQNSTSNGTDHRPIPSVRTTTYRRSTSPIPIPTTVQNIQNQSSPPSRNLRQIASWVLLSPPSVSALERLKKNVSEKKHLQAMNFFYDYPAVAFTERNKMGDTYLMTILRNPTRLENRLPRLAPMLAKMETIPDSLIARNPYDGYDALYLAAINCTDFDFVTGVLAAYIMKTSGTDEVWRRTYDNGNTLIHAVAARGDKYEAILRELLAVKTTENCSPFDLSAKNREGKTPCHVAVESHDLKNGVSTTNIVRILMEYRADPTIKENKNGDTALHMAMSRKCSTGLVQALLCNTGSRAANIVNYAGNTPIHLAAGVLNDVDAHIQIEVCYRLIAAGARTNILNRQHRMPLSLVTANRRPTIKAIFYKKS